MSTNTHSGSDDKMCTGAMPDLLRPEVLDAFDRETFEGDGYWVWEAVVTDAGCKQWTANLEKLQQMNDGILMDTDWAAIDFEGRGLAPPPAPSRLHLNSWHHAAVDRNKCHLFLGVSCVSICINMGCSVRGPR